MSDPVSNHDIEDVLSSIRRLVAQGDPRRAPSFGAKPAASTPRPAPEPAKQESSAKPAPTDRLVLTPALRVLTPDDAAPQARDTDSQVAAPAQDTTPAATESVSAAPTRDQPSRPAETSGRASLEAKIAALEAAVSGVNDDWEPDGSESVSKASIHAAFLGARHKDTGNDSDEASVHDAVFDHIAATVADEIAGAFPHLTAADEDVTENDTVVPLNRDRHISKPTVVETRQTPPEDNEEPVVIVAPKIHTPSAFRKIETPAPEVTPVEPQPAAAAVEPAAPVDEAPEIEVVEPVTTDAPTFRRSFRDVYDPVAEATADAAEAAPDRGDIYGDELAPDPDQPGTALAEKAAPAALIDPDMLRDMVSQMIREELQGEMGERITRNVRKLVRREINRVLSAQEFD